MLPLSLAAPAKLNLSLAVLGRRPDGRHELASLFALLDLADRLLLLPGCSGLRVETTDASVPVDATNLAWRGLLAGFGGEPELACLTVEKRIPATAGLGGGSSDAAAGWRLGRRLAGAAEIPTAAELERLGEIGADVPFFAAQLPVAEVRGIGERLQPADVDAAHVVLAVPPFGLSTAAVFAELRPADWSREPVPAGHNDLLVAARRLRPELDAVFDVVAKAGGTPRLTGSGPTVYALSDDPERADALVLAVERAGLRALRTRLPGAPSTIQALSDEEEIDP
jgi:4-diphosphocytidyl-2-C-methyl-D-erythritol kinase